MAQQIIFDGQPITKTVNNPLVAIIGIDDYHTNPNWQNLKGVIGDVEKSIKLWSEYFCYDTTILANKSQVDDGDDDQKGRTKIYHDDIYDFMLEYVREPLRAKDNNYDALIFLLFGHGKNEALIASDCTPIYYDEIREYFNAVNVGKKWAAHSMRLFIIDTCRGSDNAVALTIPSRGNSYNPRTVNKDGNICTYYATTKNHTVGDQNLFINAIDSFMRNMDLEEYTLYDIITKIANGLSEKSSSWYCPEFVSTNNFKIKLKRKTNVKKGNVKYYTLEGEEKSDDEIVLWSKSEGKQAKNAKSKGKNWWDWCKDKMIKYGWYIAVITAFILFYYAGKMQGNPNWKFVFPFKMPIVFES